MYGHVHIAKEYELTKKIRKEVEEIIQAPCNMYNVGCMLWDYKPVTLEEVLEKEGNE
jgi:calcineurin-like phosphoesterase family protein